MTTVLLYTTPTCGYCKHVKQYFNERAITFKEVDVASDHAAAAEMVAKSGQMAVPVVSVVKDGKENLLVGYNKGRLDELFS